MAMVVAFLARIVGSRDQENRIGGGLRRPPSHLTVGRRRRGGAACRWVCRHLRRCTRSGLGTRVALAIRRGGDRPSSARPRPSVRDDLQAVGLYVLDDVGDPPVCCWRQVAALHRAADGASGIPVFSRLGKPSIAMPIVERMSCPILRRVNVHRGRGDRSVRNPCRRRSLLP